MRKLMLIMLLMFVGCTGVPPQVKEILPRIEIKITDNSEVNKTLPVSVEYCKMGEMGSLDYALEKTEFNNTLLIDDIKSMLLGDENSTVKILKLLQLEKREVKQVKVKKPVMALGVVVPKLGIDKRKFMKMGLKERNVVLFDYIIRLSKAVKKANRRLYNIRHEPKELGVQ